MIKQKRGGFGVKRKDCLEPLTSMRKTIGNGVRFCIYDIESKKGDTQRAGFERPFLVGFFDPETLDYEEWRDEPHLKKRDWRMRHISPGGCVDKFLTKFLTEKYNGCVCYAHNGGNFDHLFLLHWLLAHRDEFGFEIIPVQSSIQVLRVWRKPANPEEPVRESWDFLDSVKLLPMSLAKACETFNVPSKIDHDLHRHEDDPSWSEYLAQDCRALAGVMMCLHNLVENRLGGELGITTPSTSMKLFRREFMGRHGTPSRIPRFQHWPDCRLKGTAKRPGPCMACAHDWIRRGYYGGRTEIFRMYGLGLHYYDIRSSYVAAMKLKQMPIGARVIEHGKIDWRRHFAPVAHPRGSGPKGKYSGFAECTVFVPPDCPIPPLPHKDVNTGKLCFPTGTFHGVWSMEELALLDDPIVGGHIQFVTCTVWFKLQPMFETMMDTLWKFRDARYCRCGALLTEEKHPPSCAMRGFDEGLSALAKLLGNGVYGKFAMRSERKSVVFLRDNTDDQFCCLCGEPASTKTEDGRRALCVACDGSKCAMDQDPDGDVFYQAKKVDAPYIIPHVSSHITALARERLWQFMRTAIRTPGKQEAVGKLVPGDVVFLAEGGVPLMVIARAGNEARCALVLRDLNTGDEDQHLFPATHLLRRGGKLFYCDTDSIITDIVLPNTVRDAEDHVTAWGVGPGLGEMNDEYPGEELNYLSVQPKVYVLEKALHNGRVAAAHEMLRKVFTGELDEATDADVRRRRLETLADVDRLKEQVTYRSPAWHAVKAKEEKKLDYWKMDPLGLKVHAKVTMKGFPMEQRTKENLEILRGGKIDWAALAEGTMPEVGTKGSLTWTQLEKVRSLARVGFQRPPKLREGDSAVSKSFQSPYDKRKIVPDGSGRTVATVLNDPVGGYKADAYAEDAAE